MSFDFGCAYAWNVNDVNVMAWAWFLFLMCPLNAWGLGMQVFCTLPVAGPAESMKNKTELWHLFASFLFAFNVEKDETF